MRLTVVVLIALAQPLFSDALASALRKRGINLVEPRPQSWDEMLVTVEASKPDVLVLGEELSEMTSKAMTRAVISREPTIRLVLLRSTPSDASERETIATDAVSVLSTNIRIDELTECILRTQAGRPMYEEELRNCEQRLADCQGGEVREVALSVILTPRELEVLRFLATGIPAKEIARRLDISVRTVRTHLHHILTKTKARSQLQLALLAHQEGIV